MTPGLYTDYDFLSFVLIVPTAGDYLGLYYHSTGPWACGDGLVSSGRLGVVERSTIGLQLAAIC